MGKSSTFLKSPVRNTQLMQTLEVDEHLRRSGDTALTSYTMLGETHVITIAVGKDMYREMINKPLSESYRNSSHGNYKLEVWHYDSQLLSGSREVDKLSLYLSMQNEQDEKGTGSIKELINSIEWL